MFRIFFSLWVFYKVICCCEQSIIFVLSCRWNLINQEFKNDDDNWSPNNSRTSLTLHHFLNTLILVIVIFTCKEEKDNKISFLDISISRNNNALETSIFRKPTFSGASTLILTVSYQQNIKEIWSCSPFFYIWFPFFWKFIQELLPH